MAKITSQMIDVTDIAFHGVPWFSDKLIVNEDADTTLVKDMFDRIVNDKIADNGEVLYLSENEFVYNDFLDWEDIHIVKIEF